MPMIRALRLCPQAIRCDCHFQAYKTISLQIRKQFLALTPLVEPVSLDEAYLDVSARVSAFSEAEAMGRRLKAEIKRETQLTASVGIGPNKFLAKIASDYDKPDGFFVIHPQEAEAFLTPQPTRIIPGVGSKTEERLTAMGIRTVGELRSYSLEALQQALGNKHGSRLHELARGVDPNLVVVERKRKSLSKEHTFSHDLKDSAKMHEFLRYLAGEVAAQLDKLGLEGRTIGIKVRFEDFTVATRALTLDHTVNVSKEIAEIAINLLKEIDLTNRAVRLLGVRAAGFEDESESADSSSTPDRQLMLW